MKIFTVLEKIMFLYKILDDNIKEDRVNGNDNIVEVLH